MTKHRDRQFKFQAGDWMMNLERFYERHGAPDPQTGCIPWAGVFNNVGYPFMGVRDRLTDKYKMVTAHRVALTIKLGRAIQPGMNANHSCHRKDCVNPDHLSEGTQTQKILDMTRDGIRTGRPGGQPYNHKQHGRRYKYSEEEIQAVRTMAPKDIAARYNLPIRRAYTMKSSFRKTYRWLPLPDQIKGDKK